MQPVARQGLSGNHPHIHPPRPYPLVCLLQALVGDVGNLWWALCSGRLCTLCGRTLTALTRHMLTTVVARCWRTFKIVHWALALCMLHPAQRQHQAEALPLAPLARQRRQHPWGDLVLPLPFRLGPQPLSPHPRLPLDLPARHRQSAPQPLLNSLPLQSWVAVNT